MIHMSFYERKLYFSGAPACRKLLFFKNIFEILKDLKLQKQLQIYKKNMKCVYLCRTNFILQYFSGAPVDGIVLFFMGLTHCCEMVIHIQCLKNNTK